MQAALRATPQYVFGAVRPFVVYEIAQLALAETGAVVLAKLAIADDLVGAHAVAPEDGAQGRRCNLGAPREERIALDDARLGAEIASGQWRGVRPCSLEVGKVRLQPFQHMLRQVAISRDLAAEYRQHGRGAGIVVHAQGVVARHHRWLVRAVVVKWSDPRITPDHVMRRYRFHQVAVHRPAEV